MTTETKALYEKRGKLVTQMQAIVDAAKADNSRSLSKEEDVTWNKLDNEQESILSDIRKIEKLSDLTSSEKERFLQLGKDNRTSENEETDKAKSRISAFTNYLIKGVNQISEGERKILRAYQNVGTTTEGGFLVPEEFMAELSKSLLFFGGVREVARTLKTNTGADMPWPNMNDTANSAAILAESNAATT